MLSGRPPPRFRGTTSCWSHARMWLRSSGARARRASRTLWEPSWRRPAWPAGAFDVKRFLSGVVLAPIRAYQRFISPAMPRRCRYHPTCSAYAVDAVREFGVLRGVVLAGWRLLRRNPFSPGGYDPVEKQTLFKRHRREAAA